MLRYASLTGTIHASDITWSPFCQERLTRGTVLRTMRRAAHLSGCAWCDAGVGCSTMKYQFSFGRHPKDCTGYLRTAMGSFS